MRSKFAIFGHPIHPALVTVPIGLFVWAFFADIIYLASDRDQTWYDISYWTGIAAVITGLAAAVPGIVDYLTMGYDSEARGIGLMHAALNIGTVAVYFIAFLLMIDYSATDRGTFAVVLALHAFGSGWLFLSGWLGGEMVFRHHLAMIPDTEELERTEQVQHRGRRTSREMR